MKKTSLVILAVAVLSFALVGGASAAMIEGGISLAGGFSPTGGVGDDLSDATGIDFLNDTAVVVGVSGDFSILLLGTTGAISDFTFNPFPVVGVTPLWTIEDFSFDLETVSFTQSVATLELNGMGSLNGTGFDPTPGSFILTANADFVDGKPGPLTTFSWSSSNASQPIPEPATMLLFGTGLVGLAGLGRRKLRKK